MLFSFMLFFFFKQKTAYELRIIDWSSDVCSSDLCSAKMPRLASRRRLREILHGILQQRGDFGPIRSRCSAHQEPGHSRGNVEHLHALGKIELPDGRRTVGAEVDDAARSEMLHGLPKDRKSVV